MQTQRVGAKMSKSITSSANSKAFLDGVEITSDTLTGRGGLSLFVRYLRGIGINTQLETFFGSLRRSRKGQPVSEVFKQLFCFFLDGTSRHLVHFDALTRDAGYAGATESAPGDLVSSHAVKRFFQAFWWPRIYLFRHLLQRLFLWRLSLAAPAVVILGIDTMVMDNDEARVRHGVRPTYKKVNGFQPLQMSWREFVIDAVFRRGDAHSNNGDTVAKMVIHIVAKIRKHHREDVPIIVRMDSGFFDQKLFDVFEGLQIGYICGGKFYEPVKDYVRNAPAEQWERHEQGRQVWLYLEFGSRCESWGRFRRAIFCQPLYQDDQMCLPFARPDTILYTNLGMGESIDRLLVKAKEEKLTRPDLIIATYHGRGSDELVHRALKDFGFEQLPFKRFAPNAAFYYTMLVSFFLYETFKQDVCSQVLEPVCYATTLRRRIIDFAAKIVRHGGRLVLKITAATCEQLNFFQLWERSLSPPRYGWA
jgi:hypothetical protein